MSNAINSLNRIAVLPLANVSPDPNDSYFAEGLTDEIISSLSKVNGLSVISRTSIMQYRNKPKTLRRIGKELKAGTLLEGSVRKAGNTVRIAIQMVDASQDKQIWAESYDRELKDIFELQSEIAQRVTEALKLKLLPSEKQNIGKVATENPEAYKLYLKGRYEWEKRSAGEIESVVECFRAAVALDSRFASAYAGMADCYAIYSLTWIVNPGKALPKARKYALKALEIDPDLAEARSALGYVYAFYDWKWEEAERAVRRAIELEPSYATAHFWYGKILCYSGRYDDAYAETIKAAGLDPLSSVIQAYLAYVLITMRKWDEAIEQCKRTIKIHPQIAHIHRFLAWAYHGNDRNDNAIEEMKRAVSISSGGFAEKAEYAILLDSIGHRNEAKRIHDQLVQSALSTNIPAQAMAEAFFSVGKTDEAFTLLEKAFRDERGERLMHFRVWPFFDKYRKDRRWSSLEKSMSIPKWNTFVSVRDKPTQKFKFEGPDNRAKMIFDFLVRAFIEDYMRKRLFIDQSGWRSLIQTAEACNLSRYDLYSRQGGYGQTMSGLVQKGLVETRTFIGHRGRGGEVTKIRIAYDREPTKRYVDEIALAS